jgi:hypothetical protein
MDKRIGFGPRLGALIIDVVLVCIAVFAIGGVLGGLLGAAVLSQADTGASPAESAAAGGLIGALGGMVVWFLAVYPKAVLQVVPTSAAA